MKNPKNYFEGFFSGASRISRVWGRHSPTRFPQGQNERKANFGTAVESCSVTSALPPPSASFTISTLSSMRKRRFLKTFSLLLIQHQRCPRSLAFGQISSLFLHHYYGGRVLFCQTRRCFSANFPFTPYYNRFLKCQKWAKKAGNLCLDYLFAVPLWSAAVIWL